MDDRTVGQSEDTDDTCIPDDLIQDAIDEGTEQDTPIAIDEIGEIVDGSSADDLDQYIGEQGDLANNTSRDGVDSESCDEFTVPIDEIVDETGELTGSADQEEYVQEGYEDDQLAFPDETDDTGDAVADQEYIEDADDCPDASSEDDSTASLEYVSDLLGRLNDDEELPNDAVVEAPAEALASPDVRDSWKDDYLRAYADGIPDDPSSEETVVDSAESPQRPIAEAADTSPPTFAAKGKSRRANQIARMRETANIMSGQALRISECAKMVRRGYQYIFGVVISLVCSQILQNVAFISETIASVLSTVCIGLVIFCCISLIRNVVRLNRMMPSVLRDHVRSDH